MYLYVMYGLPPDHPKVDAKAFFIGSAKFQAVEVEVFRDLHTYRHQPSHDVQYPRHSLQGWL